MNQNLKRFFSIAALLCSVTIAAQETSTAITCNRVDNSECQGCPTGCTNSQNLWQPHAFSVSAARNIMLEKNAWAPMDDEESWHGTFGVGFEYQSNQSRNNCCAEVSSCCKSLGSVPFWSSQHIVASGDIAANTDATYSNQMTLGDNSGSYDLDVYQMGMGPVTTNGTVQLDPRVYQTGADFLVYFGAHRSERGFWLRAHAPVGVISINPVLTYSNEDLTSVDYPAGALGTIAAGDIAAPYENIAQAFNGQEEAGFLKKMQKGRIGDCARTSSAQFGDLEASFGYNVYADECKHLGIAVTFSAPTGNKADGTYVLEPIFGRNGHWGAGGSILGHWRAWESDTDEKHFDLWLDGTAMHLFRSKHCRSFDLANGAGSKYLLVAKYAGTTFQNSIQNAVNITTIGIESTFAVEGNFALGFDFHWCNWSFMVGYEGWGRSCEKICLDCSCPGSTDFSEYAVLGRQTPYSLQGSLINLAEPCATIGKSLPRAERANDTTIVDATNVSNRLPEDALDALNIQGQRAHAAYTSKPFAQVQHTWTDSDYSPYLAISGGYEFTHLKNSAVNLWNVGLQGGIAF